ncbi:MAG: phenylacetate--CoA ligase family protein [Calditrichota bacterium]
MLDKSQWDSRQKLEDLQFSRLKQLLIHAGKHVPFYRDLFRSYGFDPAKVQSPADIRTLPFLTKEIIRSQGSKLMAENAAEFQPRIHRSAGTTGQPIIIQMDRRRHSIGWADMYRWWSAAGWKLGQKQFVVAGAALRPRQLSGFKARLYSKLNRFEDYTAFNLTEDVLDRLLNRLKNYRSPVFLRGYASSMHILARYALAKNWDGRIQSVFTTAETLFPEQRQIIESGLHAPVFDQWGCRDGGISAFECNHHQGLHLAIENAFIEICDQEKPVSVGQPGNVIATDLFSYAMPIIRYSVGDVASFAARSCDCGRGLPLISSVLGRVSNFLVGSGGKRVHGEFFSHVFWETPWVKEFQIVQDVRDEVIVKIVPLTEPPSEQVETIRLLMQKQMGDSCRIRIEFLSDIPAGAMGKRQFIICNVPA